MTTYFDLLLYLIKTFEGLSLKVYLCPAGIPTVGWGHTGPNIKMGMPDISISLANQFLIEDATLYYNSAIRLSPVLLKYPYAHIAIADFCFNLGATRYKISTLKRRIDVEDWEESIIEINKWVHGKVKGKQTKLNGLIKRRRFEAALLSKYI